MATLALFLPLEAKFLVSEPNNPKWKKHTLAKVDLTLAIFILFLRKQGDDSC